MNHQISTDKINLIEKTAASLKADGLSVTFAALQAALGKSQDPAILEYLGRQREAEITGVSNAACERVIGFSDEQRYYFNVVGDLLGNISFAQHHTMQAQGNCAQQFPGLVSGRRALLMYVPSPSIKQLEQPIASLEVSHPKDPSRVIKLTPPSQLPSSDQVPISEEFPEDSRPRLEYSTRAWSAMLPAEWMVQGLALELKDDKGRSGTLAADKIDFESPAELVLQTIRIGMLTEPMPSHWFQQHPAIGAIDYFQKMPVAKLIHAQYLPAILKPICMPNGTRYDTMSTDTGTATSGDLCEQIGKALISTGINNANFGIVDSAGSSQELPTPLHYRQVVVHTSVGVYKDPNDPTKTQTVQHGGSGGNGLATVFDSYGNEFSQEVGYAHGLKHYIGGANWSEHSRESGWGYDDWRQRFIGNIYWEARPSDCVTNQPNDVATPPFRDLFTFNHDPMGEGVAPTGAVSNFTLHTGYTGKLVQDTFSDTPTIDSTSSTGYRKWNPASREMEEYPTPWPKPVEFGVPVVTLVGFFDPTGQFPTFLYPLYGNYGHVYDLPKPSSDESPYIQITGKSLDISVALSNKRLYDNMNKFHINIALSHLSSDQDLNATFYHKKGGAPESFSIKLPKEALPSVVIAGGSTEGGIVENMPAFYAPGKKALIHQDVAQTVPAGSSQNTLQYLSNAWRPIPRKLDLIQDLNAQLCNVYGPIHQWGEDGQSGRPGTLYTYWNGGPYKWQYFMLKKNHYGYFPLNSADNDDWRYLGNEDAFFDSKPNPIKARQQKSLNLEDALRAYYNAPLLKCPLDDPKPTGAVGTLWCRNQNYYLQRIDKATCNDLPGDGSYNDRFDYLGNASQLQAIFFAPMTHEEYEKSALQWYGMDRFLELAEVSPGTVGEIFHCDRGGGAWDYFAQKNYNAGHFPTNQTSNAGWIYLGSYQAGPPPEDQSLKLWYPTPASKDQVIQQALPIGNGRLGALVGGDPKRDFLYLAESSMWWGNRNNTLSGGGDFPYAKENFGSFVRLALLYLNLPDHDISKVTDYRRELNLDKGCVCVSYVLGGATYRREIFASHPDDVIVLQLSSQDGKGRYTGTLELQGVEKETVQGNGTSKSLFFESTLNNNGLKYAACVSTQASGGMLKIENNQLSFQDCTTLTVVFSGGTNYQPNPADPYSFMDSTINPLTVASMKNAKALAIDIPLGTLFDRHVKDYQALFNSMQINLGVSSEAQKKLDTEARLKARGVSGAPADPELEASYLQFGRYLAISSSRGALPSNLQGLWLDNDNPSWMSDYHTDINVQMNYWLADRAALSSCFDALTNYCLSQLASWQDITLTKFNDPSNVYHNSSGKVAGWAIAFSTNPYGGNGWYWHPAGNAWLCNNLWQHYEYTLNDEFLNRIYPLLKGACEFWAARLIPATIVDLAGKNRQVLIDDTDWSPEHGSNVKGITYAQELVWDLFSHYQQACDILKKDADYAKTIADLRGQLYLPGINAATGLLDEWMPPYPAGDPDLTHRHLSPLIGFYPGDRICLDTSPQELISAVTKLLTARGMDSYGWGCAWRALCWAKLKQSDKAYALVITNLVAHTAPNFFDLYSADIFQIDANFGTPAAMLEMLLYSRPGRIELLPALPSAWSAKGSVTNIGARGGFSVDVAWENAQPTQTTIRKATGLTDMELNTKIVFGKTERSITLDKDHSEKVLYGSDLHD